jgi:hypothetical protein
LISVPGVLLILVVYLPHYSVLLLTFVKRASKLSSVSTILHHHRFERDKDSHSC